MTYRTLTDVEADVIRLALGPFISANLNEFQKWSPKLGETILEAAKDLHTNNFECSVKNGPVHVLAQRDGTIYAVTPELQNGMTKAHLRAALATIRPWNWNPLARRAVICLTTIGIEIYAVCVPPQTHSWLSVALSSPWVTWTVGCGALGYLLWHIWQDNPVRYYVAKTQLLYNIVTFLSKMTPEEVKAENAKRTRHMPSRAQVMSSAGGTAKPPPQDPKPA